MFYRIQCIADVPFCLLRESLDVHLRLKKVALQLEVHTALAEDWGWFPKPTTWVSSQPPVTPAPGNLMPTSVLWADAHRHTQLKDKEVYLRAW